MIFNSLEFFAEDLCQPASLVEAGDAWFGEASQRRVSVRTSAEVAQNVVDSRNSTLDSFCNHRYEAIEVACKDLRRAWPCCYLQTDRSLLMRATIQGRGAVL